MSHIEVGVWVWGGVAVVLAGFLLSVVVAASFYIEPSGTTYKLKESTPRWLFGLFYALKEVGSPVAGVLAFSGLAWAYFFTN